jgi:hypothetical protein
MGIFGNDDSSEESPQAEAINEQIRTNAAELETKKQNLYQTRLDIIKGEGAQTWTPNTNSLVPPRSPTQRTGIFNSFR